jgi:ABC-type microcin C transport system permease subunit YejB
VAADRRRHRRNHVPLPGLRLHAGRGRVGNNDIDLLLGCSLVSVFVVLFTQLISDVGYAYLNPRIRVQ